VIPERKYASGIALRTALEERIKRVSAATERTIALLKERRAALISAAVTGAINLRNAGSTRTVETPTQ
jgi:hypothetical protein